jgi:hypothetical protein
VTVRSATWAWLALFFLAGCRRAHQVGDHVLVAWRGGDYPAVIVGVESPSKFHVHYDGFSEDWDEVIPATRIRARLSTAPAPMTTGQPSGRSHKPPASASGSATAAPLPPSVYKLGDRVRGEWHGSMYTATVVTVLGDDRYRVHYEGYGNEWDEDIALSRIQRKGAN